MVVFSTFNNNLAETISSGVIFSRLNFIYDIANIFFPGLKSHEYQLDITSSRPGGFFCIFFLESEFNWLDMINVSSVGSNLMVWDSWADIGIINKGIKNTNREKRYNFNIKLK